MKELQILACMQNALLTFCQVTATLLAKETKQKDPDIHIFIYSKQNFHVDRKGHFRLLHSSILYCSFTFFECLEILKYHATQHSATVG